MKTLVMAAVAAALLGSGPVLASTHATDMQQQTTFAAVAPEGNGHVDIAGMPPKGYTAPEGTATA